MLIRLTLNRVEYSQQPLYPFFVFFVSSELLITKKEYNHCTATKFSPYLKKSNDPYPYALFVYALYLCPLASYMANAKRAVDIV